MLVIGGTAKEAIERIEPGDEWIEPLKDISEENFKGTQGSCHFREVNGIKYYFIFLHKGFDGKPDSYVTLSHEILHLCQFLLPDFIDRNVEVEAEAYFHSHIMSQCLAYINEYNDALIDYQPPNEEQENTNLTEVNSPANAFWTQYQYGDQKFMHPATIWSSTYYNGRNISH